MTDHPENAATAPGPGPRADCTVDADGRVTFRLPPGTAAGSPAPYLLLRLRPRKGRPEQGQPEVTLRLLDPEPGDGDDRRRAVLDPRPALAEGRWDVYLVPGPGAPPQRVRPGLRDLRALVGGPLREVRAPVAVRIPYATTAGSLAVRTWLRDAHAEVERIEVTDRSMTVGARLHGVGPLPGTATVRLCRRGGDGVPLTLEPRAGSDGRGFSFTVDYGELAVGGTGSQVWDLSVRLSSADGIPPVRIGRLLDDLADRKDVFVYPAATIGGVVVRPYYTVDNDLSVQVTPAG
ncbi:transferase [Streptomyces sp. H51]|uniref:transferase n=1 Tax=Streptomyces sp. H51 TaxID=3111770 RepID=UPI002D7817A1|nr:transferase [Streptomyces sp. H51]